MRYVVKRIFKRAGINKTIHPHQLRHSYATHLVDDGAPLEVIQSLLGHEKSETTRIYAHLSGKLRYEFYNKFFKKYLLLFVWYFKNSFICMLESSKQFV